MEKRKAKRRTVDLSAEVYTQTDHVVAGGAENLCDEGVCLTLGTPLPQGTIVGVSMIPTYDGIQDPDAAPINLPAKVVWCNDNLDTGIQTGMCFVDPAEL